MDIDGMIGQSCRVMKVDERNSPKQPSDGRIGGLATEDLWKTTVFGDYNMTLFYLNQYERKKGDRVLGNGALLVSVKDCQTYSMHITELKESNGTQQIDWIVPTASI